MKIQQLLCYEKASGSVQLRALFRFPELCSGRKKSILKKYLKILSSDIDKLLLL